MGLPLQQQEEMRAATAANLAAVFRQEPQLQARALLELGAAEDTIPTLDLFLDYRKPRALQQHPLMQPTLQLLKRLQRFALPLYDQQLLQNACEDSVLYPKLQGLEVPFRLLTHDLLFLAAYSYLADLPAWSKPPIRLLRIVGFLLLNADLQRQHQNWQEQQSDAGDTGDETARSASAPSRHVAFATANESDAAPAVAADLEGLMLEGASPEAMEALHLQGEPFLAASVAGDSDNEDVGGNDEDNVDGMLRPHVLREDVYSQSAGERGIATCIENVYLDGAPLYASVYFADTAPIDLPLPHSFSLIFSAPVTTVMPLLATAGPLNASLYCGFTPLCTAGDALASAFYSLLKTLDDDRGRRKKQQDGWPRVSIHSVLYVRNGGNAGDSAADDAATAAAAAVAAEIAEQQRMRVENEQWRQQQRRQTTEEADGTGSIFSFFEADDTEPEESMLSFLDEWY
ncbi:hypothetical protein cyc_01986 [Cyclospora cayetanensis]|uniref:Uncharacterized protein n=1 Tax=Cyclospora cayetanensis TaxID=88456 RepID=A0A1D3CZJ9_9EIME|nr:hypothetical protein cyc_01986 [Cyclospora cayetanensis]